MVIYDTGFLIQERHLIEFDLKNEPFVVSTSSMVEFPIIVFVVAGIEFVSERCSPEDAEVMNVSKDEEISPLSFCT